MLPSIEQICWLTFVKAYAFWMCAWAFVAVQKAKGKSVNVCVRVCLCGNASANINEEMRVVRRTTFHFQPKASHESAYLMHGWLYERMCVCVSVCMCVGVITKRLVLIEKLIITHTHNGTAEG